MENTLINKPTIDWIIGIFVIIVISIIILSNVYAGTRIVAETSYAKAINWNAGCELLIKGTTSLSDALDIKYGVSEQFAADRSTPFSLNHDGLRYDIGFLARINDYIQVGYTHSGRMPFEGANVESIYLRKSIDTLSIRWDVYKE